MSSCFLNTVPIPVLSAEFLFFMVRMCILSYKLKTKLAVVIQLLSCVWLFATPWTALCQASLSFLLSWSLFRFMFIESVMLSKHLILCCALLHLPSIFPSITMISLFRSGGKSIEASASASDLPMNIQGWFPLGLVGLISLLSKSLLQHHNSKASILWSSAFFLCPTLKSLNDYWKNHSFD